MHGYVWLVVYLFVQCRAEEKTAPCVTSATNNSMFSYFHMNGQPLKSVAHFIKILQGSRRYCFLNTSEIINALPIPTTPIEIAIILICAEKQHIHLTSYEGSVYKHILFHVEIGNCTIDLDNINNLINVGDTKVLAITAKLNSSSEMNTTSKNSENSLADGLHNVVAFVYINQDNAAQQISDIFKVNQTYPHLAEVSFSNMSLETVPGDLKEIFPNLQSLELPNNKLSMPPETFPWIESLVRLPRNISRSPFMQSHYSVSEHVIIPDNIFRRFFVLDDNNITDLRNFTFHGTLHKISLRRNGLEFLGEDTFSNVTGVQNLDISKNKLKTLPLGLFDTLVTLRRLDISENQLENLTTGLFNYLHTLEILNLGNNSLESLPDGIFANLLNLVELRLNHNKLKELNQHAFPLASVNLKRLYFHFNPLKVLPEFPFWIRGLTLADFHSTDIIFENFTQFLESINELKVYQSVVDSASSSDVTDLVKRDDVLRKIDLSNCNISSLKVEEHLPKELEKLLLVLLLHFRFDLENNPILCDCNINTLAKFIDKHMKNGTIPEDEYYFKNWVCQKPRELAQQRMLKVKPKETYCKVSVVGCPVECSCYERDTVKHIIVDCRNQSLSQIHSELPIAPLELWYSENNITQVTELANPENIIMLDVSFNRIEAIDGGVFNRMKKLKDVRLHSNALAYLPSELKDLNLTTVKIWPNPFTCDCRTRWMKKWLENKREIITNSDEVACKIESEEGKRFTEVPDEKFLCHTDSKFDEARYVIMPSIVCSTIVIIVLIFVILFYTYRLECKVLLFVYFGVHPFDRDSMEGQENIDCVVVHSGIQTDWVMEKIVSLLENENYHFVVCDMARDFVVGYSFQENLTRTVRNSKRMIFCLSNDWPTSSENFVIAWRIAQEKIKETKSHYGIIVSNDIKVNDIKDNDLRRFIKRGRFVDSKDKLFRNKIVYYMPNAVRSTAENSQITHFRRKSEYISRCFINSYCEDTVPVQETDLNPKSNDIGVSSNPHAFISYHDDDFDFVLRELLPLLDEKGFSYCIPDRDFLVGASIEENVLNAIDRCHRTIFILSPSHVIDEWSLFTFRTAYEKSLREKSNHLLVLIKEEVEHKNLDEEVSHYLKNYICLNVKDKWFEKKLFNGLPLLKDKEELHSSPLFINKESIQEKFSTLDVQ
nr:Twin-TIR-TLR [Cyclina sinensis]